MLPQPSPSSSPSCRTVRRTAREKHIFIQTAEATSENIKPLWNFHKAVSPGVLLPLLKYLSFVTVSHLDSCFPRFFISFALSLFIPKCPKALIYDPVKYLLCYTMFFSLCLSHTCSGFEENIVHQNSNITY